MIIVLGVDVSRETVGAVSHTNRDIFSFIFLYSHYIHQIMDRQYHQLSDLLGQRQQLFHINDLFLGFLFFIFLIAITFHHAESKYSSFGDHYHLIFYNQDL